MVQTFILFLIDYSFSVLTVIDNHIKLLNRQDFFFKKHLSYIFHDIDDHQSGKRRVKDHLYIISICTNNLPILCITFLYLFQNIPASLIDCAVVVSTGGTIIITYGTKWLTCVGQYLRSNLHLGFVVGVPYRGDFYTELTPGLEIYIRVNTVYFVSIWYRVKKRN